MPELGCSVAECGNNSNGCCCLNGISVSGGKSKENTCCESFSTQSTANNAVSNYSPVTNVNCMAKDCEHNENCSCKAQSVKICSCGSDCDCHSTECTSYRHE